VTRKQIAKKLAALFETPSMRQYVYWKLRSDPAYAAALEHLHGRTTPMIDVGCGIGLLPFFLRENGYAAPITGIDFDLRKIELARRISTRYRDLQFITGDARDPFPTGLHDVVILDLLQYIDSESQQTILSNAAKCGNVVVIRQGIRDQSWRYRVSTLGDAFGRAIRWMKAERLHLPTREEVIAPFEKDFEIEVRPMWGRTPYNNYLFVMRRRSAGVPAG
jgi:SAM-dependent methyltransferase